MDEKIEGKNNSRAHTRSDFNLSYMAFCYHCISYLCLQFGCSQNHTVREAQEGGSYITYKGMEASMEYDTGQKAPTLHKTVLTLHWGCQAGPRLGGWCSHGRFLGVSVAEWTVHTPPSTPKPHDRGTGVNLKFTSSSTALSDHTFCFLFLKTSFSFDSIIFSLMC